MRVGKCDAAIHRFALSGLHVRGIRVLILWTGSNMINYYAPVVYASAMGLSRNLSLILGGCTSLTYLVGSAIPLWIMDRFGRRPLLMFSASGLCLCFSLAAILLSVGTLGTAYGATAMVFLFQIFLGIGYLPIPWFYPSEVCTTRIRSRGQAFAGYVISSLASEAPANYSIILQFH